MKAKVSALARFGRGSNPALGARVRLAFAGTLLASLIALVAILAGSAAPATASESCPNEARREEQGAAARALPDCRAYELVTPSYQPPPSHLLFSPAPPAPATGLGSSEGSHPERAAPVSMQASEAGSSIARDGGRVLYNTFNEPNSESSAVSGDLSWREPSAWLGESLIPPRGKVGFTCDAASYTGHSADLGRIAIQLSNGEDSTSPEACGPAEPSIAPGESPNTANLFLRNAPGPADWQLVNVTPQGQKPYDPHTVQVSEDGSEVVFASRAQLTPDALNGETLETGVTEGHCASVYGNSYVWRAGSVHLLTVLPGGAPVRGMLASTEPRDCASVRGPAPSAPFIHPVSADGARIVFYAGGGWSAGQNGSVAPTAPYVDGGLYLRENPAADAESARDGAGECTEAEKACTVQLDASAPGAPGSPGEGQFQWANAAGTKFFFTDVEKLTASSTAAPAKPDLYEYDTDRPAGQRLVDLTADAGEPADVLGLAGASADGSYVYFAAQAALTGSQQNSRGDIALGPAQGSGTMSGGVAKGTGKLSSTEVTELSVTSGEFRLGQEITGEFIFPQTTITACSPNCSSPTALTLSQQPALQPSISVREITGLTSKEVTGLSTTSGAFREGMAVSGPGIPPETWVTAVGSGTLTLSRGSSVAGAQALSATAANLYLRHGETTRFIASLSEEGGDRCDWTRLCLTSRVSQDGRFAAFDSFDRLTGYDNRPLHAQACRRLTLVSGSPCPEAFRYASAGDQLTCAGCDPTGAPPATEYPPAVIPTASDPAWPGQGRQISHAVSNDGDVFFTTDEKLLPNDENETWDVYEYKGGEGPSAELHLISTGESESPSTFDDATPDGSNVFFFTIQRLLRADTRSDYDLYDARVGGGFPEPLLIPCEAEGCKGEYSGGSGNPSPINAGGGNVHEKTCRKGYVLKRGHCVKVRKHKRKHRRRAHHRAVRHNRGAAK